MPAVGLSSLAVAQAPPGTTISNTASVEFIGSGGLMETVSSNTVDIERAIVRTTAALELLRYSTQGEIESIGPSACLRNGSSSPFPAPRGPDGAALDASLLPLADASAFHAGEAVFVRVSDADQNLDSSRRETVQVRVRVADTGDELTVQLAETAAASGVFAGYVPTTRDDTPSSDCELGAAAGARLTAEYADPSDPTDSAAGEAEFDPIGSVFDALTGLPVDGAVLTLVDADTGTEATVYGDDGRSIYPATVTAGSTIVDSAGTTYELDPGSFRFPIVPSGDYLLRIEPPTGYRAPTTRSAAELQSLDGAPFVLVAGSFGNRFTVGDSPLVAMDVPVDPAEGDLFLSIAASAAVAAPGDFVEFRLALSHNGGLVGAEDVVIRNQLPPGLRYETGTAFVRDGDVAIEPLLSADGRTLEFPVGALPGGESVEIVYVAAVVPGSRGSALTNGAVAESSERESNFASARVALIDDFFTDTGFIAGRVTVGQCLTTGRLPTADEQAGFAGVRVYLEDGRFAVTDAGGRYHFEGIDPGTHVVQIDVDSIGPEYELIDCGGLEFAGSSVSRFIDLAPGQLRRADFTIARKPPPSGSVTLSMTQSLREAAGGDRYEFELTVGTDDDIRTGDVELMLMLPPALRFDGASDSLGNPIAAQTTDEIVLLPLGNRDGPWSESLRVRASAEPQASGEFATRSLARFMFDGKRQSTPVAETRADVTPGAVVERSYSLNLTFDTLSASLNEIDRSRLDKVLAELRGIEGVRLEAIGHSDSVPISVAGQARFADNYVLSAARARAVVEYLRTGLSLDANRVRYAGLGPDQPVASNATTAGRSMNRRVDLVVTGTETTIEREVRNAIAASEPVALGVAAEAAALPTKTLSSVASEDVLREFPDRPPDAYDPATLTPGRDWLWPPQDHSPAIPNTKVAIKHSVGERISLTLNGIPVDVLNFDGVDRDPNGDIVVSRWRGLDLADGANLLVARVLTDDGEEVVLERRLHFAGTPVRGSLLVERSALVADGKSRPVLVLRLEDRWGKPAREGATGQFEIGGPYRSWWEVERLRDSPIVSTADQSPTYVVGADGIALIELEPTTTTGQVELVLKYPHDQDQTFRAYVEPGARDWILVGLAEGTVAWNRVAGNLEVAGGSGFDNDYYDEGRLAFYAKGRVKGAVITAALDSSGDRDDRFDAFGGVIDPDLYYTVYGDDTDQRFDAPSRERLYLKLERGTFHAMFGDFETGLTVTELSRYSRSMTGFRSERHGERVSYSAFAARSDSAFMRDEIRGDGTSGPYRLQSDSIVAGSDKIAVEARDRFRPERIVASRVLRRHFDYDIDYVSGALFLREPLASRDFDFNPQFLVVDYEVESTAAREDGGVVAGGRVAVALGDIEGSEVGVTVIDDATTGAEGRLAGADLRYLITPDLEVGVEVARSVTTDISGTEEDGAAYSVEVAHRTSTRQVEAYVRETEAAFGLGQQRAFEPGTRRSGVAMRNELGPEWLVEAEAFRQNNLIDSNTRTVIETESRYEAAERTASFGIRRIDETVAGESLRQDQAFVGGSWRLFGDLLTTRINLEDTLTDGPQSGDYPTRVLLGADVAAASRIDLFGEHEIASGDAGELVMTRVGIRAAPLQGSQIDSSVHREMTEYGPRSFANLGMRQSFMLNERWAFDFGGERSAMLAEPDAARFDSRIPPVSGNTTGDYESGFFGVAYRAPVWSFTSRLEYRETEEERRNGLLGSFFREAVEGRAFTAEMRLLDTAGLASGESFSGMLRVGWAYRPARSRWMLFNRADWIADSRMLVDRRVRSRRLVNNFNAHYAVGLRQEVALKYSIKSVVASFETTTADNLLDLFGVEWRRQLAPRFDVGLHASTYRAIGGDLREDGYGLDFGIAVARNFNLRVGYNIAGFEDDDFSRAHYTARGPYLQFRLKLDQAALRDILRQ